MIGNISSVAEEHAEVDDENGSGEEGAVPRMGGRQRREWKIESWRTPRGAPTDLSSSNS